MRLLNFISILQLTLIAAAPHIESDGCVTLRVYAPNASGVSVTGDLSRGLVPETPEPASPAENPAIITSKGADGVWTGAAARRIKPGAWRCHTGIARANGLANWRTYLHEVAPKLFR
jgi:hypothetical protein